LALAVTVLAMVKPTPVFGTYGAVLGAQLGDIVTLPDGRHGTVRAIERKLHVRVGSMSGFLLVGEVGPSALLLSVPGAPDGPVAVYTPIDHIPAHAANAKVVCEGVVSYWAPHLPNLTGAMGELGFKVCAVRGTVDPMVILWRGPERVVFVCTSVTTMDRLGLVALPRDATATEVDQARYAGRVTGSEEVAVPERAPAHLEPARQRPRR